MTDEEKRARLQQALSEPETAEFTHDQIRSKLAELDARKSAPAQPAPSQPRAEPKMTVDLGLGPREYPDTNDFVPRVVRGLKRIDQAVTPVITGANKVVDTATLGIYGKATDAASQLTGHRIGASPQEYEQLAKDHPFLNNLGTAGGYVMPTGLASAEGKAVNTGVDLLTRAIRRRVTSGPARVAERALSGSLKGAGTNALIAGSEAAVRGESPGQALDEAAEAAKRGALLGGGFGAIGGTAAELATARRAASPELQTLDRYGMEPGPIPGRPVIRKDESILSQAPGRGEPALGVSRVTPATRAQSARAAMDEIAPDIRAREVASNQRFGQMQAQAYASMGRNPADITGVLYDIDQKLGNERTPDSTRTALENLRGRLMANAIQTKAGIFARAQKVDELRDYADYLGRQDKIAGAPDVPLRQVGHGLRESLKVAAPQIYKLNEMQHEIMNGFEERRAMVDMPKGDYAVNAKSREAVLQRGAQAIRQGGEETATAGIKTTGGASKAERLGDMGPPPVFPGVSPGTLPPPPSYRSLTDMPRLQLAQERLQLTPSKVFSGGGKPFGSELVRMATAVPDRVAYPLARRLGNAPIDSKVTAVDDLSQALTRRGKKRRKHEDASP